MRTTSEPALHLLHEERSDVTQQDTVPTSVLDVINVVPNPYYAFSQYETSKLDNRVKITNLPEVCTIRTTTCRERSCVLPQSRPTHLA